MLRPPAFNKKDHYWFVGGDETQAYSSLVMGFVPLTDINYLVFINSGHHVTRIPTLVELEYIINEPNKKAVKDNLNSDRVALNTLINNPNSSNQEVRLAKIVKRLLNRVNDLESS